MAYALAGWAASVPTPKEHLGFMPGDDYKLADYGDVVGYFKRLEQTSPRIKLIEIGKSSEGRPIIAAFLANPEMLAKLDRYREISRKLALGTVNREEAKRLASEGKPIVWIDSGLHASEVAPVQQAFHLAYRMVTGEDEETRKIRARVILMQVPVINPDGLDMIAHWYRKNAGTPYELAGFPGLYQKYAGHDNNRDYFMLNLPETRAVTRALFTEWFPQIVYNQHQAPPFPARIFIPPYAEPLNPNIPAAVMEGIHLIGGAMKERFAREGKTGVLSYHGYDAWWNGGLRSVPAFHNMHGILTETAGYSFATPFEYKAAEFPERFGNGMPTHEPSVFYSKPWLGGRWALRDAIDYMLTADFAILDLAASRPSEFLYKAWEMAAANIETGRGGKPFAYVVPAGQHDWSAAVDMVGRLQLAGIEVRELTAAAVVKGRAVAAGSYVLLAAQPFRGYLVDLMEPQKYPEIRVSPQQPTKRPYDVAGWTLPYNMGVEVARIDEPVELKSKALSQAPPVRPVQDFRQNASFLWVAEALARQQAVYRNAQGDFVSTPSAGAYQLAKPRVAVYEPFTGNIDTGWTEYVLDNYHVAITVLHNEEVRGDLRQRFDSVILATQTPQAILHGTRTDEAPRPGSPKLVQRPEFTGGIGVEGVAALERFVKSGGTLIAFDEAANLPIQFFPLPLRNVAADKEYYCPGSLLRVTVDTTHPAAFGMPREAYAFVSGGQAWEIGDTQKVRPIARYAGQDLLASGWLSGKNVIANKHAAVEVRHGQGSVILFGFRPQFRAQSTGTFKLVLNAIYQASAKGL